MIKSEHACQWVDHRMYEIQRGIDEVNLKLSEHRNKRDEYYKNASWLHKTFVGWHVDNDIYNDDIYIMHMLHDRLEQRLAYFKNILDQIKYNKSIGIDTISVTDSRDFYSWFGSQK